MSASRQYAIELDAEMPVTKDAQEQLRKFQDLARELECEDDEAAFEERFKKVARAPRPPKPETPSGK
jgi:hypothetical protein